MIYPFTVRGIFLACASRDRSPVAGRGGLSTEGMYDGLSHRYNVVSGGKCCRRHVGSPPRPKLYALGVVAGVNIAAIAIVRYASNRAKRETAAAWLNAGPTLDVILCEYAARHEALQDTR